MLLSPDELEYGNTDEWISRGFVLTIRSSAILPSNEQDVRTILKDNLPGRDIEIIDDSWDPWFVHQGKSC